MTQLRIDASRAESVDADRDSAVTPAPEPLLSTSNAAQISAELETRAIKFQRWPSKPELEQGAKHEQILTAYQSLIASIQNTEGYQSVDVMRVGSDQPNIAALRQTFLGEHQHVEDEVLQVTCEANDWIAIPAGTRHCFDMGANPDDCVLRFFKNAEGWVAHATQVQSTGHSVSSETVRRPLQAK